MLRSVRTGVNICRIVGNNVPAVSTRRYGGMPPHIHPNPRRVTNQNAKTTRFTANANTWRCSIWAHLVYYALQWHSLGVLKRLLSVGYPMAKYKHGYTPLMVAVDLEDFEAVSQLIHAGAPLNEQDDLGDTALMRAAHSNNRDILEALLQGGAQTDIRDSDYMTAADWTNDKTLDEQLRQ